MVECSSCGEKFESLADFDNHVSGACKPVDDNGVVRHPMPVEKPKPEKQESEEEKAEERPQPVQRREQKRGGKVAEVSKAPERETR